MTNKSHPSAKTIRRLRQIVQLLALLLFLALLLGTRGGQSPVWLPGNSADAPALFFRFDPLSRTAAVIAGRTWLPGLGLALLTIALP